MSGQAPQSELTALESALRDLAPAGVALDRDALMFRAGQAAAPHRWFWPAATAVSSSAAVVLAVLLACRPTVHVERIVPGPTDQRAPSSPDPEETSVPSQARAPKPLPPNRRLEERLLRWGLDGLGEAPPLPPSNPFMPPFSLTSGDVTP
jgi:hypothetical protein